MSNIPRILVIDDEPQIRRLLDVTLGSQQYRVLQAENGREGLRRAETDRPDLIILDLGLPDADGKDILRQLRSWTDRPVLILSVRNSEDDIVGCLDAGADDYLVKPFRTEELLARVRAAMRHRQAAHESPLITLAGIEINTDTREVKKQGSVLKLTAIEYSLLMLFVRNAGRVLTHRYILEQVWGPSFTDETQYTRVYVGSLRKKIEDNPAHPRILLTESGIGYRFAGE
ncbi:MAG TPA: response regulator [Bacteroidota bacterium]|nr:response regulator [Bacteroidota bacterium]